MTEKEFINIGNLAKIRAANLLVREVMFFTPHDDPEVVKQAQEQFHILRQLAEWEDRAKAGLKITP